MGQFCGKNKERVFKTELFLWNSLQQHKLWTILSTVDQSQTQPIWQMITTVSSSESLNTCQTHEYSPTDGIIKIALTHAHFLHCKWPFAYNALSSHG